MAKKYKYHFAGDAELVQKLRLSHDRAFELSKVGGDTIDQTTASLLSSAITAWRMDQAFILGMIGGLKDWQQCLEKGDAAPLANQLKVVKGVLSECEKRLKEIDLHVREVLNGENHQS